MQPALSLPAGALPSGTVVSLAPVTVPGALRKELPKDKAYISAFAVSWSAPGGSVPDASTPLTLTIEDPSIKVPDTIYLLTPTGLRAVGTATVDGSIVARFSTDPAFVVARRVARQVAATSAPVAAVTAGRSASSAAASSSGGVLAFTGGMPWPGLGVGTALIVLAELARRQRRRGSSLESSRSRP